MVCGKCNESFILNQRRSRRVSRFQYKENRKRLKLKEKNERNVKVKKERKVQ